MTSPPPCSHRQSVTLCVCVGGCCVCTALLDLGHLDCIVTQLWHEGVQACGQRSAFGGLWHPADVTDEDLGGVRARPGPPECPLAGTERAGSLPAGLAEHLLLILNCIRHWNKEKGATIHGTIRGGGTYWKEVLENKPYVPKSVVLPFGTPKWFYLNGNSKLLVYDTFCV